MPRNYFWRGLRWKQTHFLVTLLAYCAVFAALAYTNTGGAKSNPGVVLRYGEFKSLFTRRSHVSPGLDALGLSF